MRSGRVSEGRGIKGLQTNSKVTIWDESFFLGFHFECVKAARRRKCSESVCVSRRQSLSSVTFWEKPAVCFLNLLEHAAAAHCCAAFQRNEGVGCFCRLRHTRSPAPRWLSLITKRLCDFWRRPGRQQVVSRPQYFIALQKECSISDFTLCADVENTKKLKSSSSEIRWPHHPANPLSPPPDRPGPTRFGPAPPGVYSGQQAASVRSNYSTIICHFCLQRNCHCKWKKYILFVFKNHFK